MGSSNRRYRYKVDFKTGLIQQLDGVIKHSVHSCFPLCLFVVPLTQSLAFPGGRIAAVVPRFISKHHTFQGREERIGLQTHFPGYSQITLGFSYCVYDYNFFSYNHVLLKSVM